MMSGGASAQVCRLLPDNAEIASILVKLELKETAKITVYERNPDGSYKLDGGEDKIPVKIDNPEYTGPEDHEHPEKIDKKILSVDLGGIRKPYSLFRSISSSAFLSARDTWPTTRPSSSGLSTRFSKSRNNWMISFVPPHINQIVVITPAHPGIINVVI